MSTGDSRDVDKGSIFIEETYFTSVFVCVEKLILDVLYSSQPRSTIGTLQSHKRVDERGREEREWTRRGGVEEARGGEEEGDRERKGEEQTESENYAIYSISLRVPL